MSKQSVAAVEKPAPTPRRPVEGNQFEAVYRAHVRGITAYFARRARDPQTVADLTAETFVEAVGSFRRSSPRRGAERAWVFAIARRVYARHCEQSSRRLHAARRASAGRELGEEAVEDLLVRIDAERAARQLLARLAALPSGEREALELVELAGLTAREAADALGVSAGALRVRLFRARARLRREREDVQIRG
ncbi:MAG TPA: RNA polymerase sigma factor [Solirubrobacteraceae bacterium]|nr:RNA polymerase sigma factor [Solirubrobacteraceae bacterium]